MDERVLKGYDRPRRNEIGKEVIKLTHNENSRSSSASTKGMKNSFVRVERFILHDRLLLTYTV
ncbi:hypothetical protein C5167_026867 [Papaver somniferum]|nr:hypothetical protein C5167_026867 [Papaver somniferum]